MRVLLRSRDAMAAVLVLAFGAGVLFLAHDYELGTLTQMGSGFFPFSIGLVIVILGLSLLVRSNQEVGVPIAGWHFWPVVIVLSAVAVFALLVETAGLAAAAVGLGVMSRLAVTPFRPIEVLGLALALAVIASTVFVYLLALPLRIW